MKKRFVFIGNMAAPHQVRFCQHLQKHFQTEFWFYEHIGAARPAWWKIDLPPECRVLGRPWLRGRQRYLTLRVISELRRFDPDVIMLGGFFIPSNYLAYQWGKRHGKTVIVFTETFRKEQELRGESLGTRMVDLLYRDLDAVFACHDAAADQMRSLLPRLGPRTYVARYSSDIDRYFQHPFREAKPGYVYIFPNRLIDKYNPILAIEIFAELLHRCPESILKLNPSGERLADCQTRIDELGIAERVEFLTAIEHWDDLSTIYRECDVLLFPARFSNGNFTILECMASGMGIVISNKIVDIPPIEDGVSGFVRPPDREQFLEAVGEYIDRPELFEKHAVINRAIVAPYSGAGTAELFAELIYEKVLGEDRPS